MVDEKRFREDLLYRLNVVKFEIPPLRERKEDIPLLCRCFLDKFAAEIGHRPKELTSGALRLLKLYDYPGNVRELKNIIERLNIYTTGHKIDESDLRPHLPDMRRTRNSSLKEAVRQFEHDIIKRTIAENDGNISRAARQLGLERSHLYKKLKKND